MLAKEKRLVGMPGEGTIYANVRGLERIWHTGGQQTAFHSQSTRNGILNGGAIRDKMGRKGRKKRALGMPQ